MKTLKEKSYKVMSGTKTYRLLEREPSDKGDGCADYIKYVVTDSTGCGSGFKENELPDAEKYFEEISSFLNWL